MFSEEIIIILTIGLAFMAMAHFIERGDEFLFIPVLFFASTGILRYWAVTTGLAKWVVVAYSVNIFNLDNDLGLQALNYFFFGTSVFMLAYYMLSRKIEATGQVYDNPDLFAEYLLKKRKFILVLFGIVLVINAGTQRAMSGASQLAYGMSYFYLFQLAIGGIILLMYLVFDYVDWERHSGDKLSYGAAIVVAAGLSYNPYMRFQFLSWMICLVVMWGRNKPVNTRIKSYLIGGTFAVMLFAIAGNSRHAKFDNVSTSDKIDLAVRRLVVSEDQNMLDGLMMVLQVYPEHLDYGYGMEHIEILLRPIPRAIWPGKPVGGYANKLGLNDNMNSKTVGISQTIYGSFYGEGGFVGIVIFSILYAILFVRLFQYSFRYHSSIRYMIKGIAIASLIPLLRGGDLPGIFAFIGMSYWPVFLFIRNYHKFLFFKKTEKAIKERLEQEKFMGDGI